MVLNVGNATCVNLNLQNFVGEGDHDPQTHYGLAPSALENSPYFHPQLKRGWNLCRADNLEIQIQFLAELHFHLVPSLFLLL